MAMSLSNMWFLFVQFGPSISSLVSGKIGSPWSRHLAKLHKKTELVIDRTFRGLLISVRTDHDPALGSQKPDRTMTWDSEHLPRPLVNQLFQSWVPNSSYGHRSRPSNDSSQDSSYYRPSSQVSIAIVIGKDVHGLICSQQGYEADRSGPRSSYSHRSSPFNASSRESGDYPPVNQVSITTVFRQTCMNQYVIIGIRICYERPK
jgi:hypothetical protein